MHLNILARAWCSLNISCLGERHEILTMKYYNTILTCNNVKYYQVYQLRARRVFYHSSSIVEVKNYARGIRVHIIHVDVLSASQGLLIM
jgi:hypothetical protein